MKSSKIGDPLRKRQLNLSCYPVCLASTSWPTRLLFQSAGLLPRLTTIKMLFFTWQAHGSYCNRMRKRSSGTEVCRKWIYISYTKLTLIIIYTLFFSMDTCTYSLASHMITPSVFAVHVKTTTKAIQDFSVKPTRCTFTPMIMYSS